MTLRRKQLGPIPLVFDEGEDEVRLLVHRVGRAAYRALHEDLADDSGEVDIDKAERALLTLVTVDEGDTDRPLTTDEIDEILNSDLWNTGDAALVIATVRSANEGSLGKVSKAGRDGSKNS